MLKACAISSVESLHLNDHCPLCVVEAMHVVNQINPKPACVKMGADLAKEFNNRITE